MRSSPSLPLCLQPGANRVRDPVRFGVRRRHDERRLGFAVPFLFGNGRQIGVGQLLVAVRIGYLLDPAELVQLLECFVSPALAQRLRRFLVITLLAKDLA